MKHPRLYLLTLLSALSLWLPLAHGAEADEVAVSDATVRSIPPVVPNSAAFMHITNTGDTPSTLVAVSGTLAKAMELHTHINDQGVMRMRRVAHIHLPPGKTVSLQSGGLHIMLFGIQQPLKPGKNVQLTLEFADGSKLPVSFRVVDIRR